MPFVQTMKALKGLRDRRQESALLFSKIDANGDNKACHSEMAAFVASNANLWHMLTVNLGMSEPRCHAVATRVTMELATGLEGPQALLATVNKHQFHQFRQKYMLNGHGNQEFFHRCVFAAFDMDHNSFLDLEELDELLETFYKADSIFQGDMRLPDKKEELKRMILEKYDTENLGKLSFDKVRGIISGTATCK